MALTEETVRPALDPQWPFRTFKGKGAITPPLLAYGRPYPELVQKHVRDTFRASRAYVLASRSLARDTDKLERLEEALGDKLVGLRVGMKPHTYMSEVLEIVQDARRLDADIIVTLGGGSLSDAAKIVAFALSNDVTTADGLRGLPHAMAPEQPAVPSRLPIIAIPTTLSAGEYTPYAGVTDDADHSKYQFCPPLQAPAMVVLDGDVAATTPLSVWLSTGIRGVDHCVEALVSADPATGRILEADEAATEGLRRLISGLLQTKKDPEDAAARHRCQLGAPLAVAFVLLGVHGGASHGIGHMLGPLGVGHGETSCILLPAVQKWNAAHGADADRQKLVRSIFWSVNEACAVFEARGLAESDADLGDLIDAFVRELGMPRSLAEFGIGEGGFEEIAKACMKDAWLATNPVPITESRPVFEILQMCK